VSGIDLFSISYLSHFVRFALVLGVCLAFIYCSSIVHLLFTFCSSPVHLGALLSVYCLELAPSGVMKVSGYPLRVVALLHLADFQQRAPKSSSGKGSTIPSHLIQCFRMVSLDRDTGLT